jgi:hypothetical protein
LMLIRGFTCSLFLLKFLFPSSPSSASLYAIYSFLTLPELSKSLSCLHFYSKVKVANKSLS